MINYDGYIKVEEENNKIRKEEYILLERVSDI